MTRVAEQVKTNTQLFLDELWKHSDNGKEVVDINIGELSKDYKYFVKAYLLYLQKIGCIECDYFGDHYLVAVKSKEVSQ
ncbi:hypothetical protein EFR21_01545 [Lactobacillus delbrueckii subsp. bulgaricus]|uniref:hypothetical protein n=1 Tax=Lactobacillus delbrueckii TaxID=1584 RepID=UPI0021A3A982|nr:hypothetical protein [Lactobacillus delbrueckii]MCT3465889.1 hypothetical protein [Lactobacillus delbrueckii subsp. bulgaricus]MCT3470830.1 hypothetical protein [Lactobacillus delbrueckii subsp. bulgaricus]